MNDPYAFLSVTGRILVAFHFLWSAWSNVVRFQANVDELVSAGVRRGAPFLVGSHVP